MATLRFENLERFSGRTLSRFLALSLTTFGSVHWNREITH